jgi:hypothetical protein
MRYLKPYNESSGFIPLVEGFITKILNYKSDKITNLQVLKVNPTNNDWEIRTGYANRKTITFDNKISNKQEKISIEEHANRIRVFHNDNYRSDISYNDIAGYERGVDRSERAINHIFDDIIKSSNNVVDYFRKMDICDKTLNKLSEEIISEQLSDIIDISSNYGIRRNEEQSKHHFLISWVIDINLPTSYQKTSDGAVQITFDDTNKIVMESLLSVSNRLKEENIVVVAQFKGNELRVRLHAMDTDGSKIGH